MKRVLLLWMLFAAPAAAQDLNNQEPLEHASEELLRSHQLARCLVRSARPQVVRVLEQAAGSAPERSRVAELRVVARPCVEAAASISRDSQYEFSVAALRGVLAEALYESDFAPGQPVPPRALATLPGREGAAPGGAGDRVTVRGFAFCVVSNAPDAAAALLATEPGSRAELEDVQRFVYDSEYCFPVTDAADAVGADGTLNVATVRGFVAEAVYRHFAALARGQRPDAPTDEQLARRDRLATGGAVIVPIVAPGTGRSLAEYLEDVRTLVEFGRCVGARRTREATALLELDYQSEGYEQSARRLAGRGWACTPDRPLRFSGMIFAGGLAEGMLPGLLNGADLQARIGTGRARSSRRSGQSLDAIGLCLVGNNPAGVSALLATAPASADESRVAQELTPSVARCVTPGEIARINQPMFRALAALAAYRLLQETARPRPAGS
jgi:hypothetical protein